MIQKTLLLLLLVAPIFGGLRERERVFEFAEFVDPHSCMRSECTALGSTHERICKLTEFFTQSSENRYEASIIIPSSKRQLHLVLNLDSHFSYRYFFQIHFGGTCFLRVGLQKDGAYVWDIEARKSMITGNEIMHILESVCYCCGFQEVTLVDCSCCEGFQLLNLLPYCIGHTWYAKSCINTRKNYAKSSR